MENKIKIFENKQVRTAWNADEEEWYANSLYFFGGWTTS